MFEVFLDWDKTYHNKSMSSFDICRFLRLGTSAPAQRSPCLWRFQSHGRQWLRTPSGPPGLGKAVQLELMKAPHFPTFFHVPSISCPSIFIRFHPFPSISPFRRLSLLNWLHPFSQHLPSSGASRLVDFRQPRREELTLALGSQLWKPWPMYR